MQSVQKKAHKQWAIKVSYESYVSLVNAVENIRKNLGTEYTINFA
ncbi:MAG: hypothetical protein WBA93_23890 [Microcoleaceae cyanobacterium]